MPQKRKKALMPNYKPDDEPEQRNEFNQPLNMLQGLNGTPAEKGKRRRGSRKSKSNVKSDGGRNESEIGHCPPKRPRVEASITLNIPNPWRVLPGLQPHPNSTLPANVIPKQEKVPVATSRRSLEEVSTHAMTPVSSNCVVVIDDTAESISGCSDLITMIDVMNMPTQVTSNKPTVSRVYSFEDLNVTNKMKIQTEEIVESMRCDDEGAKAKRKTRNVSLVERFTNEEIMLHINSLTEESNEIEMDNSNEDLCQLCGCGKVMFPPPPVYCSHCNIRIENSYRAIGEELIKDVQYQLCTGCHKGTKKKFTLYGIEIKKDEMLKVKVLDNKVPEEWVQCGTCEKWQHQICGLYNKDKDIDNSGDYICPKCLLEERQSNNNSGFDDNTDLGAKDLPETILSYFIEQRLFRRLKEERSQTAETYGKSLDEVLEPEGLTLRVVYSSDKTSIVNEKFVGFFHKENFPSEFPNRSKVILLFQKVEGVDVCIFAMFVQEYGSECSQPNQRTTYIVYLDSVKYFRPERLTFSGEALRTFVYHEILIGYLEYCKLRGFTTCYIWSCPPKEGQDYIMYSHPKTQKTPLTKQLRRWYMSMLNKAVKEKVVVNVTNLHERFFVRKDKYTAYIPAARVPYFDGSFWYFRFEEAIKEIESESSIELPKMITKLSRRKRKGVGYDINGCVDIDYAKNYLLMEKVETKVSKDKEDYMVAVLNYSCTRCSKTILSGFRWFCNKCVNLHLCESCYDEAQELPGEHIHSWRDKEKHELSKVEVKGIWSTTEDNDLMLENDMFESRNAFLDFSENHNYHFNLLRRAKHSSMMILHHLHTSNKHRCSQKTSRLSCGVCNKDVSTTIYYPCLMCSIFRLCIGCYAKNTSHRHLHLYHSLPSTKEAQPRTVMGLEILNALSHVHKCHTKVTKSSCSYPKCNEVKLLFYHSAHCGMKDKATCCKICRRLGKIIRIHANHCNDLECPVTRCKETKEYFFKKILEDKGVQG